MTRPVDGFVTDGENATEDLPQYCVALALVLQSILFTGNNVVAALQPTIVIDVLFLYDLLAAMFANTLSSLTTLVVTIQLDYQSNLDPLQTVKFSLDLLADEAGTSGGEILDVANSFSK